MKILLKRGFFLFCFFTLLLFTRCGCLRHGVTPRQAKLNKEVNPDKTLRKKYDKKLKSKEHQEQKLTYEEKEKLVDEVYRQCKEEQVQSYKREKERVQNELSQVENQCKNLSSNLSSQDIHAKESNFLQGQLNQLIADQDKLNLLMALQDLISLGQTPKDLIGIGVDLKGKMSERLANDQVNQELKNQITALDSVVRKLGFDG